MTVPLDAISIVEVCPESCDFCRGIDFGPQTHGVAICAEHFARLRLAIEAQNRSLAGPPAPLRPIRLDPVRRI